MKCALSELKHSKWSMKEAVLQALKNIIVRMVSTTVRDDGATDEAQSHFAALTSEELFAILENCLCESKYSAVRQAAIDVLEAFFTLSDDRAVSVLGSHASAILRMLEAASRDSNVGAQAKRIHARAASCLSMMS